MTVRGPFIEKGHIAAMSNDVTDAERRLAEDFAWMLKKLDGPAREEFADGFSKEVYLLDTGQSEPGRLLRYLEEWMVSVRLQHDPEWQRQMAESEKRIESDDLGEPVDAEGLGHLLGI